MYFRFLQALFLKQLKYILLFFTASLSISVSSQDIDLFAQFNGRYDYTAIGNTLNPNENNVSSFCSVLNASSANLNVDPSNQIIKAYLYWAGSGPGDSQVSLNSIPIIADDTYTVTYTDIFSGELIYFSCYADITNLILNEGNGTYQLSDIDINSTLLSNSGYCNNRTNFGGWSIYVIYENNSLPLNQINLYQGLEIINRNEQEKEITLTNVNVLDNQGAKIGFLAWEGDNNLNFGESLSINDNIISNPPLNLADNAFNGTNTFTNSSNFYNADLDVYDIENNINIGDTSVSIKLTTGDFGPDGIFRAALIIINNIITVLNSQLPDATIAAIDYTVNCGENNVDIDYTVSNVNSTALLPANTPIAFYVDGALVGQSQIVNDIPIGGSETNTATIVVPETSDSLILVLLSVDDDGTMASIIPEINEENNLEILEVELLVIPDIITLPSLLECNEGFETGTYNLFEALSDIEFIEEDISFYTRIEDLEDTSNEILIPTSYNNAVNPQTIYIRKENAPCYEIFQFNLNIENCPPYVPQGFSPNEDSYNDWFNIQRLYNVFIDHELKIYNRLGTLIFEGDNEKPWDGKVNRGINNHGKTVPIGTYFYILNLNDPNYLPMTGWVYVNY